MFFDNLMIRFRVKTRIQYESRTAQIHANHKSNGDEIGEGIGQNRYIVFIARFDNCI